jgi:hypothetical protein
MRVQIQKDLLGETGLMFDQPGLDRHRLTVVPAGMTQEHPRHQGILAPVETYLVSTRLLESAAVNAALDNALTKGRIHASSPTFASRTAVPA